MSSFVSHLYEGLQWKLPFLIFYLSIRQSFSCVLFLRHSNAVFQVMAGRHECSHGVYLYTASGSTQIKHILYKIFTGQWQRLFYTSTVPFLARIFVFVNNRKFEHTSHLTTF